MINYAYKTRTGGASAGSFHMSSHVLLPGLGTGCPGLLVTWAKPLLLTGDGGAGAAQLCWAVGSTQDAQESDPSSGPALWVVGSRKEPFPSL